MWARTDSGCPNLVITLRSSWRHLCPTTTAPEGMIPDVLCVVAAHHGTATCHTEKNNDSAWEAESG